MGHSCVAPHTHDTLKSAQLTIACYTSESAPAHERKQESVEPMPVATIWSSFFHQCRQVWTHGTRRPWEASSCTDGPGLACVQVGETALLQGLLTSEDCVDNEPFLYLGLPALTMLEALVRSLPASPADSKGGESTQEAGGGILLAIGRTVTADNCPPEVSCGGAVAEQQHCVPQHATAYDSPHSTPDRQHSVYTRITSPSKQHT